MAQGRPASVPDGRPGRTELDLGDQVAEVLQELPVDYRLVLTLRYLDDWSVGEVAEAIGSSYSATESLLARARRAFGEAFEEER